MGNYVKKENCQSIAKMHFSLNWAKRRINEMDAALVSFEVKAETWQRLEGRG